MRPRPVRKGTGRGDSRCARPLPFREASRSLMLLRRGTLSHANNLRKRYGDYDDNGKENERREDHDWWCEVWCGFVMIEQDGPEAHGQQMGAGGMTPSRCGCRAHGRGSSSASVVALPGDTMTRAFRFAALSCHMSSRHLPHGAMIPVAVTATTHAISDSLAFSISATAACSAQKPMLHAVSMQMPM